MCRLIGEELRCEIPVSRPEQLEPVDQDLTLPAERTRPLPGESGAARNGFFTRHCEAATGTHPTVDDFRPLTGPHPASVRPHDPEIKPVFVGVLFEIAPVEVPGGTGLPPHHITIRVLHHHHPRLAVAQ